MKRFFFGAAVLTAFLAMGVGPALAQSQQEQQNQGQSGTQQQMQQGRTSTQTQSITGTVVSVNDNSMVISRDDGTRMTLALDNQTNKPMDVNVGDRVRIDYTTMGTDRFHAMTIAEVSAGTEGRTTYGTESRSGATGTEGRMGSESRTGSTYGTESRTSTYGSETRTTTRDDMTSRTDASGRTLPATAGPLATLAIAGAALVGLGAWIRRRRSHSH